MSKKPVLGILGGSGLYEIDGLSNTRWQAIETPFLPRHGRGHKHSPSTINYRANIDAMKRAGVTDILSLSACGSFREMLPPGTFVIVDQFIDRTFAREKSFFGEGLVAHVSMGHPVCGRLGDRIETAAKSIGLDVVRGGTYLTMEGPQFSTKAESELYRSWNCDVIGMTNMPEAKLAREAEICYATIAMVTDFDCWHPDHDHVQVSDIIRTLLANADHGRNLVRAAAPLIAGPLISGTGEREACSHGCDRALEMALITSPQARNSDMIARLDAVAGRVLKGDK
jgi:5'-methylthioadenosine phosphorylase